jgi:transcriptional regulator
MYIPDHFRVADRAEITAFLAGHPFAVLVTADDQGVPFATHLPLIHRPGAGEHGSLLGHVARANPHARLLESRPSPAVFSGPHAYVSPRWYAAGPAVPTWNYAAVHAVGRARLLTDPAEVRGLLAELTARYETGDAGAWTVDGNADLVERLLPGIVAFELRLTSVEAKFKLGQNRSEADRAGAAGALAGSSDPAARDTAALMRGGR